MAGLSGPAVAATPRRAGKARAVILVWLWGGPPQMDTFDPKPDAPSGYRTPFSTIPTRTPGEHFTELLPGLASRSNMLSVVRTTMLFADHNPLPLSGQGGPAALKDEPSFGAIVAKHFGTDILPPFISISPPGTSSGAGFLGGPGTGGGRFGRAYDPFEIKCNALAQIDLPKEMQLGDGMSPARLSDRRTLLRDFNAAKRVVEAQEATDHERVFESAYRMLAARDAFEAFDVSKEKERVRESYGRSSFGQSLLLGRRLVEAGVPFVQVNWSTGTDALFEGAGMGWDNHHNNFDLLASYQCPLLDRGLSALLDDLQDRGLLDSTLVIAMGEMGRTPGISGRGGRDHWPLCSTLWAGGGVKPGRFIGRTDRSAGEALTEPVTGSMIGTTIAELVGLDSQGRGEMGVLRGGRTIDDLL